MSRYYFLKMLRWKVRHKNQVFSDSKQAAKTGNDNSKNRLKYSIL